MAKEGEYETEVVIDDSQSMSDGVQPPADLAQPYPKTHIKVTDEQQVELVSWLDKWLNALISEQQPKLEQWAEEEELYRALPEDVINGPYANSCGETVPAVAMAVDPVQARLSTGIFKTDTVMRFKPLRASAKNYANAVEKFFQYYQKNKIGLRNVMAPGLFEFVKHGTMIYKTIYDRDTYSVKTYDKDWKVVNKKVTRFSGPRVVRVPIQNLLFPARYQTLQDCPIVAERIITTMGELMRLEASGKISQVEKLKGQEQIINNVLETEQQISANHEESVEQTSMYLELHEIWCDYDIDGDGELESLAITYHKPTQTILQLRYNWYFHQRKPYTVIPYTVTNGSIYGLGMAEMMSPFQRQLTMWHRMATDNAYLANIRMFITQKDSGIEDRPKMYGGRVFRVENPKTDLIPFAAADVYPSTLMMQQNLYGMGEKRSGISDYMTGRESPIVGSKATATGTMALIQEGTRRVEEVMENVRNGVAEIAANCLSIWHQYGLDGLSDAIFGDEDTGKDVLAFFNSIDQETLDGAFAVDLAATDASNNKTAQQQMQLAIIQVMMGYLEKLTQVAQLAYQAKQQAPEFAQMLVEVMTAARNMFKDLLQKYDTPDPDSYIPDLEKFFNVGTNAGGVAGIPGAPPGFEGLSLPASAGGAATPNTVPSPSGFDRNGNFIPGAGPS